MTCLGRERPRSLPRVSSDLARPWDALLVARLGSPADAPGQREEFVDTLEPPKVTLGI